MAKKPKAETAVEQVLFQGTTVERRHRGRRTVYTRGSRKAEVVAMGDKGHRATVHLVGAAHERWPTVEAHRRALQFVVEEGMIDNHHAPNLDLRHRPIKPHNKAVFLEADGRETKVEVIGKTPNDGVYWVRRLAERTTAHARFDQLVMGG